MAVSGPLAAAVVSLGLPAGARAAVPDCPAQLVGQVFLPWADPGWYASVPDGGFETEGSGWRFGGGAAVVAGNEPYFVRAPGDQRSVAMHEGAWATSADVHRSRASHAALLRPQHEIAARPARGVRRVTDATGARRSVPIGVVGGTPDWSPSPVLAVTVNALSVLAVSDAAFRFDAAGGDWRVDDVYVDRTAKGEPWVVLSDDPLHSWADARIRSRAERESSMRPTTRDAVSRSLCRTPQRPLGATT